MNEDVLFLLEIWNFPASHVSEQLMSETASEGWCFSESISLEVDVSEIVKQKCWECIDIFYQNPLNTLGFFPYQLVDIEIKCIETLGICNAPS